MEIFLVVKKDYKGYGEYYILSSFKNKSNAEKYKQDLINKWNKNALEVGYNPNSFYVLVIEEIFVEDM